MWTVKCSWYSDLLQAGQSMNQILVGVKDFLHHFRPALAPTKPPTQWVLGHSRGKVPWLNK